MQCENPSRPYPKHDALKNSGNCLPQLTTSADRITRQPLYSSILCFFSKSGDIGELTPGEVGDGDKGVCMSGAPESLFTGS